jgi:hypothetical protein
MPLLAGTMRVNDILEARTMAPTSMHEVIPANELINDARSSVDHAANVAISGALASEFVDLLPEPVVAMPVPIAHPASEEIVAP